MAGSGPTSAALAGSRETVLERPAVAGWPPRGPLRARIARGFEGVATGPCRTKLQIGGTRVIPALIYLWFSTRKGKILTSL